MTKSVYFEDLFVGLRFQSRAEELTEEAIIRFGRENDPQYFHVDATAAKDSIFEGLVASGWQTGALTLRLLLGACGISFVGGVVGADTHIAWKRPVRPGDRLNIEGEVTKLKTSHTQPDRGFVSFRASTINQHGAVVQTLQATMLVFRDPARANDGVRDEAISARSHE